MTTVPLGGRLCSTRFHRLLPRRKYGERSGALLHFPFFDRDIRSLAESTASKYFSRTNLTIVPRRRGPSDSPSGTRGWLLLGTLFLSIARIAFCGDFACCGCHGCDGVWGMRPKRPAADCGEPLQASCEFRDKPRLAAPRSTLSALRKRCTLADVSANSGVQSNRDYRAGWVRTAV